MGASVLSGGLWLPLSVKFLEGADGGGGGGTITHGRQMNASNTGLNYNIIDPNSLTPVNGYTVYDTPGETIEGKLFNGRVDMLGDGSIMKNCMFVGGGLNQFGLTVWGNDIYVEGIDLHAASGISWYIGVQITDDAQRTHLHRVDLSGAKSQIANYGTDSLLTESYVHDTSLLSDPTNHPDNIECYGGSMEFDRNRLPMGAIKGDGSINIAPFGGRQCPYTDIHDNFIDGGQGHILSAGWDAGALERARYIKVRRNDFGGHTNPDTNFSFGIYMAATYWPDHGLCENEADQTASDGQKILWPSSGPDANYWRECDDLVPNLNGQICMPRS